MAITISNILALTAVTNINRNQANMSTTLERLSTGYRINSAADDPAGLIASESIQSEEASTQAAISNAQRADSVLSTADGALSQISNLLISLQSLVTSSANTAGLSPDQIQANQLQVDSIISSVNRISNAATFDGTKLFNGDYAYNISAGPSANSLQGLTVNTAQASAGPQTIQVQILASAQHAALIFHGSSTGLAAPVSLTVIGNAGSAQLSLASSTSVANLTAAINNLSNSTGVTASASGNNIALLSTGYGSSQYVSVQSNSDAFQTQSLSGSPTNKSLGTNAQVTINGQAASADGLNITARTNTFSATFSLAPSLNTTNASAQFTVTGGGATFAISPDLSSSGLLSLALNPINSSTLGQTFTPSASYSLNDLITGGALNLASNHLDLAQEVVTGAISQVSTTRAIIGAKQQYDIQSTINSLNVKLENLQSADSSIRDTDFATETANLAREQILAQSSQFALKAAEQNQQTILTLLSSIN